MSGDGGDSKQPPLYFDRARSGEHLGEGEGSGSAQLAVRSLASRALASHIHRMQVMRTLLTVVLLVSILPWCGITVAWATTTPAIASVTAVAEPLALATDTVSENQPGKTAVVAQKKQRPAGILLSKCGPDATLVSAEHRFVLVFTSFLPQFGSASFLLGQAQAPLTYPPRSL